MEQYDLLLVGAEVSVAYAGFAGIISTFQFRDADTVSRGDVVGLTMIVQISLVTCLYCLLPPVLHLLRLKETEIWTIGSGLLVPTFLYFIYGIHKNIRGHVKKLRLKLLFGSLNMVGLLIIAIQFLNISSSFFHREPFPYLLGPIFGLCLVSYMFVRLLLRPLWISVRKKEMEDIYLDTSDR